MNSFENDFSSRKVKFEAHGAHRYPRVMNFRVRQVLSTAKMRKKFMVIGSSLWAHGSSKTSGLDGSGNNYAVLH